MNGYSGLAAALPCLLLIAVPIIVVAVLQNRRRGSGPIYQGPPLDAEETAYLAGGRDRAVQAALAALTVAAGRVPVGSGGQPAEPAPASTNLQRAVAGAAAVGLSGRGLVTSPPVDTALDAIRNNLQLKGLLTSFGKTSKMGAAAIRSQRQQYTHFAPTYRPSWTTYGAAGAAMGVALFGYGVLASVDPALPMLFPQPRRTDGASGNYGGDGGSAVTCATSSCAAGSCGGGSSCGGGGSSCGGGGSSCGGGGGCGGGGA